MKSYQNINLMMDAEQKYNALLEQFANYIEIFEKEMSREIQ